MKVAFDELDVVDIDGLFGGEGITRSNMFVDPAIKVMRGVLEVGASIGTHTHDKSSEVIIVTSGKARFITDGVEEIVSAGEFHYLPRGGTHSMENIADVETAFLAIVPEY